MPDIDYATWLTKQQAATALGVSPKQIERLAKAGRLQYFLWKRPSGGQRLVVYAPEDIERLLHENQPSRPYIVPSEDAPDRASNGNGHKQRQTSLKPVSPDGTSLLQAVLVMFQQMSEHAQQSQTVFLTIPEAAKFTGLTDTYIRRACQDGTLKALKDGGWKIRRADLLGL